MNMRIVDIFERAQRQIGREVGYVPQQIACGWARANARDISRLIESSDQKELIATSLSELFLNTCCIADQYHVDLRAAYRAANLPLGLDAAISASSNGASLYECGTAILAQTDQLAALLASYHGWSWANGDKPLRNQLPGLHRTIYAIARMMTIDLVKGVSHIIEGARTASRSGRRTDRYDPVTSLVLRAFKPIKENSVCTFAKEANMWGARPWDATKSFEGNLNDSLDTLARLSRCAEHEEVDAFLIMFPASFGRTVPQLAKTVDRTLRFFADNDPSGDNSMERVREGAWRYAFLGVPYFVQSFGPCYGSDNTRFAERVKSTFINFVTEFSFHRLIPRDKYNQARQEIRQRAESQGRPYDIHAHETDFFVHPKRAGLPPVRWIDTSRKK